MYLKNLDEEIMTYRKKLSKAKTAATKNNKDYTVDVEYNKILGKIKELEKRKIAINIGIMKRHEKKILQYGNNGRTQYC